MADGAVGCDSSYAQLTPAHDAAYYEKWNRERAEAVARYVFLCFLSFVRSLVRSFVRSFSSSVYRFYYSWWFEVWASCFVCFFVSQRGGGNVVRRDFFGLFF